MPPAIYTRVAFNSELSNQPIVALQYRIVGPYDRDFSTKRGTSVALTFRVVCVYRA